MSTVAIYHKEWKEKFYAFSESLLEPIGPARYSR